MNINATLVKSEFETVVSFLESIGFIIEFHVLETDSFLPGISICNGTIIIDKQRMKYSGDILHEAGHLAVIPKAERVLLCEHDIALRPQREAEEMMSIAWSYAVCLHLGIAPEFVFHDEGYKGGGSNIVENFKEGRYFGVPMLQWVGMALEEKNAIEQGKPAYPAMLRWLRE